MDQLKQWARALKRDGLTLWFCCRHPGMPLLPKILALLVVGYFLSPIDLIPDFIPVLGYLDELILLPVCIYLILRMVPPPVLAEARAQAGEWISAHKPKPRSIIAAIVSHHRGSISLAPSDLGGLRMTITLPVFDSDGMLRG